ncbi:MGDG synthase family glycosyltransferase [Caldibacillus debilis]|uniref:Putative 1,2-diacylglycerol 3-glucosyltransferase n=1 Tax=Caldibacillus debilis TaxID=301148 RepID=A0A150LIR4_9BACI|nr:hypothetical protein [Caldibacillus debilis]KYD11632.1 putative 1,2-diacylglycerol 3-glucosyltransferase [Caldibacillus debilis]
MKKVLILPLLKIPTGHHHVAGSLKAQIAGKVPGSVEVVDILSESYGFLERLISLLYLFSIKKFPNLYSRLYHVFAVKDGKAKKAYLLYDWLFLRKMEMLLKTRDPDLVICTHAFPSYLIGRLKRKNRWNGRVINVYTDFFINRLWSVAEIDYHFAPSRPLKEELEARGADSGRIFVTGIPVHPVFAGGEKVRKKKENYTVLVSGGNMGVGAIETFLGRLRPSGAVRYKVLCGKNERLRSFIEQMDQKYFEAIPYISNKDEMNRLYEEADGIITKPGGVTVTECLWKRLPIIVLDPLPGQEERNLQFLKRQGIIVHLEDWRSDGDLEKRIVSVLETVPPPVERSLGIDRPDAGDLVLRVLSQVPSDERNRLGEHPPLERPIREKDAPLNFREAD